MTVDYIPAVPARRYAEFTETIATLHPNLAAATDRSAHRRLHKAIVEQRLSSLIKVDLSASGFRYEIDDVAWAAAERLDGKLLLVTMR